MFYLIFLQLFLFSQLLVTQDLSQAKIDQITKMPDGNSKVDSLNLLATKSKSVDVNQMYLFSVQAKTIAFKLNYKRGLIEADQNLCIYYTYLGKTEEAMRHGLSSLKMAEVLKDDLLTAVSNKLIGTIYHFQYSYTNALEYYRRALAKSETDLELNTDLVHNIAMVYLGSGNYQLALKQFNLSKVTYEKLNNWEKLANNLANIGLTYEYLLNYKTALIHYKRALKIDQDNGLSVSEVSVLNNIAWVYFKMNDLKSAENTFEIALKKSISSQHKNIRVSIYEGLYKLKQKKKEYSRALHFHEQYKMLQDSLVYAQRDKQIVEMRTLFETERVERENEILKREKAVDDLTITAFTLIFIVTVFLVAMLVYFYRIKSNANKILEQNVKERTIEVREKNDHLKDLIKHLEFRKAEMERYTYAVSHDLRSPLVTINGIMGLIERDLNINSNKVLKDRFKQVSSSVNNMGEKLDDLLEFTRIGAIVRTPQKVFVVEVIDLAFMELRKLIRERNVKFNVKVSSISILTDPLRLREVFQNLIENAINFCSNQPIIEIGAEKKDSILTFYIRDNGVGIDKRFFVKIFDMFERLNHDNEGSGMGLALCKRIIEIQGGKIWVDSEGLGSGSTFYFTLPKPS